MERPVFWNRPGHGIVAIDNFRTGDFAETDYSDRFFDVSAAIGAPEADTLRGSLAGDALRGFAGDDVLLGLAGDDLLRGEAGRDVLMGGAGHDTLCGGAGDDRLYGGSGADRIADGFGRDVMSGGGAADVFRFVKDGQADWIRDFGPGDRIDLTAWRTDFEALRISDLANGGVRISLGEDRIGVFGAGLAADDLDASRFVFGDGPERLLFADGFECDKLSPAWKIVHPTQWIEDGWMHIRDTDGWPRDSQAVVHDGDPTWTDYKVSLKADFVDGTRWEDFTLLLRSDGFDRSSAGTSGTAYQLTFDGVDGWSQPGQINKIWLQRVEGGATQTLVVRDFTMPDRPMDIDVTLVRGRIQVDVDGAPVLDLIDPDPLPFGGFGLHSIWESEARFDDIRITSLDASPEALL